MRRILVAAVAVAVAVGAVVVLVEHQRGRDVRGSTGVEFSPADAPHARVRGHGVRAVDWPTYGFDPRRVRVAPQTRLRPPFRRLWTFHGRALLEFPPAVAGGRVYVPTFDGRLVALDARSGRALWRYASGRCSWASPAVAGGLVYETFL